jgi:4-hydroxy-2-oxoheptanedioate aldolase
MIASLNDRIAAKGYILNGYLQLPGTFAATAYARQGWDTVTVDLEHGMIGEDMAMSMLQALAGTGVMPLCRVGWLDPAIIMKVLDAGSLGVTCPMINTPGDARRLVSYCRYPPLGERSLGPMGASLAYGQDYRRVANDVVNIFPMIETAEAIDNIAEIAAVEGINGVYIGSADLAQSMGRPIGRDGLDPQVAAAIAHVVEHCLSHDVIIGMMARDAKHARELIGQGFKFVGISTDYAAMTAQARAWVEEVNRQAPAVASK